MIDKRNSALNQIIFLCIYFLVASAAFAGFFGKWQFRDQAPKISVAQMFDGTADRPYVYRQLMPAVTNIVARSIPQRIQQAFVSHLNVDAPQHNAIAKIYAGAKLASDPAYEIRYYILYGLSFLALFVSMLLLHALCLAMRCSEFASFLAPLIFALLIPMLSTEGGYFYDLAEIGFMAAGVLLALRGRVLALMVLTAAATYNKESFLFFAVMLFPFLLTTLNLPRAVIGTLLLVMAASVVNLLTKAHFSQNPGGMVEIHLLGNLKALIKVSTYFQFEWTYGVIFPQGLNLLTIFLLVVIVRNGRAGLSKATSQHLRLGLLINLPLFLLFCQFNELRNFSLLYISLILLMACALDGYLTRYTTQMYLRRNSVAK